MWTCKKCGRIFAKVGQMHSCKIVPLETHFDNKERAKELFNALVKIVTREIGKCEVISLPCCIHLFGNYDFLAVLPKREKIEVRFSLNRVLKGPKLKQAVAVSLKEYKNCIEIANEDEIDEGLIGWMAEAYNRGVISSKKR